MMEATHGETLRNTTNDANETSHYTKTAQESGQKIVVNGVELYYVLKGEGPHVILCIPGALAQCEWAFASQLEYFGSKGSGYTVIAYDLRGYGYSRPHDRYCHLNFQDGQHYLKTDAIDAYHLMKKLGFSKFSVLGWCDGGVSAIYLAALYPSTVTKLVVWGSRAYLSECDLKTNEKYSVSKWNAKIREALVQTYGTEHKLIQQYNMFKELLRAFLAASENGDICTKEMSEIKCPTLILHGEKDVFSPIYHADYIKRNIERSELHIISEGRHHLQMSPTNERFNSLTDEFLTKTSSCS